MGFNIIIYLLYFIMCLCVGTIYTIDIYNSGKSWGWPIIIYLLPSIVFAPFIHPHRKTRSFRTGI